MRLLRTVGTNGEAHGDFRWPLEIGALVEALDWDPNPERACGGGLHAIDPLGGDWSLLSFERTSRPMIVDVADEDIAYRGLEKLRFRRCTIVEVGEPGSLYTMLCRLTCDRDRTVARVQSAIEAAKAADAATSGYGAPAATSGARAPAATSGARAPAATSGDGAPAATSGDGAPASAKGAKCIAAAIGFDSTAVAGPDGCIALAWWDEKHERPRLAVAYVGDRGIHAGVIYKLTVSRGKARFVRAEPAR